MLWDKEGITDEDAIYYKAITNNFEPILYLNKRREVNLYFLFSNSLIYRLEKKE